MRIVTSNRGRLTHRLNEVNDTGEMLLTHILPDVSVFRLTVYFVDKHRAGLTPWGAPL